MSPITRPRRISLRLLAASALTLFVALGASAASASAAEVNLNWTQTKIYESSPAVPNTNRTWLGYLTRPGTGPAFALGTATPSDGLVGPTVNTSSAAGVNEQYTWSYTATGGSLNAATLAGSIDFGGTLTYHSDNHGINITIEDPKLVSNGDGTGELRASGEISDASPYDLKLFDLDLTHTTCTLGWDGTLTLGNIVPTLATDSVFSAAYPAGSGPERSPNTFGSFSLSNAFCAPLTGPPGAPGPVGAPGPQGAPGPVGEGTTISVRKKSLKFKKQIFKHKQRAAVKVSLKKRLVGYGVVNGRKLKVTYVTRRLKGNYKLSTVSGKYRSARIKLR